MKKSTLIASVIIIFALIGGGVVWYAKNKPESVNPPAMGNENQPAEIKNQKSEIINTDDWQTYRNEEYGFEVRYPREWTIKDGNPVFEGIITLTSPETEKNIQEAVGRGRATEIPGGDIVISVVDTEGKNLENYLNYNLEIQKSGLSRIDLVKFNKTEFNNYVAYEALLGGFSAYYTIYIENDQKVYRILFELKANKDELNDAENTIIDSFEFIN